MAKKFKITEEQYNMLMNEELHLKADPTTTGGNVNAAVQKTKQEAQKNNVNLDNATIEIPATSESKIITVKELRENRLKVLKENSQYFTLNDFIKKLK